MYLQHHPQTPYPFHIKYGPMLHPGVSKNRKNNNNSKRKQEHMLKDRLECHTPALSRHYRFVITDKWQHYIIWLWPWKMICCCIPNTFNNIGKFRNLCINDGHMNQILLLLLLLLFVINIITWSRKHTAAICPRPCDNELHRDCFG